MDIKKLKTQIEKKQVSDDPIVFVYSDNSFLCYQYVNAIAEILNYEKVYINSVDEISSDIDIFDTPTTALYVYDVEKLEEPITEQYKNLIVITKKIACTCIVEPTEMPKLEHWMIQSYVASRLSNIKSTDITWLCDVAKFDIYRLNIECAKLEIFEPIAQQKIFEQLKKENGYSDLTNLTILTLSNAILQKDFKTIGQITCQLNTVDVEATALYIILIKQFRAVIDTTFYSKWNSTLSCTEKQFYYLKKTAKYYTQRELINIYEFLTSLDSRLKNGELMFNSANRLNNNKFVDYIIEKIFCLM